MNGVRIIKGVTQKAGETPQAALHSVFTPTMVHGLQGNPKTLLGASQAQKYFHSNTKTNCRLRHGDVCMAGIEATVGRRLTPQQEPTQQGQAGMLVTASSATTHPASLNQCQFHLKKPLMKE